MTVSQFFEKLELVVLVRFGSLFESNFVPVLKENSLFSGKIRTCVMNCNLLLYKFNKIKLNL